MHSQPQSTHLLHSLSVSHGRSVVEVELVVEDELDVVVVVEVELVVEDELDAVVDVDEDVDVDK